MTQWLARITGGIAIAAVLVVSAMVTWSVLKQSESDSLSGPAETPQAGQATRLGDLTGYVGRVDADSSTLLVAATPTGADPIMLVVASDATISVHGKPGGLADLAKDMPVRVFYEVRNEVKHVTAIQVVPEPASTASTGEAAPAAERRPVADSAPVAASRPVVEAKPAPEPKPVAEVKPVPKPVAEVKPTPKPAPEPKPVVEVKPAPRPAAETRPVVESRPPAEVKPPTARAEAPAPARPPVSAPPVSAAPPPAPAPAPRPRAPEPALDAVAAPTLRAPRATPPPEPAPATAPRRPAAEQLDGSDAVDWLFKERGR
jgi:hypothetical protein